MHRIQKSTSCHQPPLPRRCSDGSVSNILSGEGNSSKSIVEESSRTRSRPYYFRRCRRVRSTIESLPDDLMFHIFVRLPGDHLYDVVSLVCRRWYSVIHSRAFINSQVQHSTYGLLLTLYTYPSRPTQLSIFLSATQEIEMARMSYNGRQVISCTCNGLGIMYLRRVIQDNHMLHIVNPATKQAFVLPPVSCEGRAMFTKACIAYSAASMEYKVIAQYQFPHQDILGVLYILTVGVDNSWRQPPVGSLPSHARNLFFAHPKSTEGFIHWAAHCDVLTWDVETEVFTVSVVPHELSDGLFSRPVFRTYLTTGRYLTMVAPLGDLVFEVWMMEPGSGEWRKPVGNINLGAQKGKLRRFARGLMQPMLLPLAWVKYPEVLAMYYGTESKTCILYNLNTLEITSIDLPQPCASYNYVPHKNNLMWLT